jgi:hypothetical protein
VPSAVSQPGEAVQSPKPAEQLARAQVPVLHEVTAFGSEQPTSQSPQSELVRMSRSQPLSGLPSQLFQPVLQLGAQSKLPTLPVQLVVPWALVQALPHTAQFAVVPS